MSILPQLVKEGGACRFCERRFVDGEGNPFSHGDLRICDQCWSMPQNKKLGYLKSFVDTEPDNLNDKNQWVLKKSEVLESIQQEVESDFDALDLDRKIKREQRLELFEERWFPKFKAWLQDAIFYDEDKYCYTLNLEKDDKKITMDFYPKGNKLLVRQENSWYHGGLNILINKVLPQDYKDDYQNSNTKLEDN
jgi:hypothetical protein